MTDIDKLCALLTSWGVAYKFRMSEDGTYTAGVKVGGYHREYPVVGYIGFYTLYTFDCDGKFVEMGAWE